jgi:hypothetical protein
MSETASPHEQESSTQTPGHPQAPSAPSPSRKDSSVFTVVWPKDMSPPSGEAPARGSHPEARRHG